MKTTQTLEDTFKSWKQKKDERLLALYQRRKMCEESGESSANIDEKIFAIEAEIDQRKAKLDRELLNFYRRMEKAGASASAKKERQERTHHLCELGGLVEKAGFGQMEASALLGMLLQQKEYLESNPSILNRWTERGQLALNAKKE